LTQAWTFVTDFGDSAVTLALSVVILGYLVTLRRHRAVFSWILAMGGCGLVVVLLKIILRACGPADLAATVSSPSGHTAASATVYCGLATVVAHRMRKDGRLIAWILAAAMITAVAVSRVVLGAHNPAEVAIGLAVGLFFAMLFSRSLRPETTPLPHASWALGVAVISAVVLHGSRWPIEDILRGVADTLRASCP
jgi:membrane-associated phospholipid phosphatase